MINKKSLSEKNICSKYINPAIEKSGWDMKRQVQYVKKCLLQMDTLLFKENCILEVKAKELIFPLPPLGEQKAIIEKVTALMGLCDALEQEIEQSKGYSEQLMQSVLREVFN
ncbi:restriction endonuclease subunit S domain-containing protein [Flavobacterium jejuense]|uniref:hypothetical protein n=1 Tax=Flavobacterium jejuense TaxID=1544455 RepID=UPI001AA06ECE|nr:hypothetical protein [Flavobacterium jejuense]